jgi:molybdopterin-guanine dinucleotide biosynthesis protein
LDADNLSTVVRLHAINVHVAHGAYRRVGAKSLASDRTRGKFPLTVQAATQVVHDQRNQVVPRASLNITDAQELARALDVDAVLVRGFRHVVNVDVDVLKDHPPPVGEIDGEGACIGDGNITEEHLLHAVQRKRGSPSVVLR